MENFHFNHVRLRPEQQIVLHQQPTWELSYVICGEGERIIGNSREPFRAGEMALVLPHTPHCWMFDSGKTDAEGMIENITVTFTTGLLDTAAASFPDTASAIQRLKELPGSLQFPAQDARQFTTVLDAMLAHPAQVQLFMLLQIIMQIALCDECRIVGRSPLSSVEHRLREIDTFITCNYKRQVTLQELAQHIGMNQTSLCKFLKRHLGKTFMQCLNSRRIAEARYLLRQTNLNISEICYHCGFNDIPHFCRMFKREERMTPKKYRELSTVHTGSQS